MRSKLNIPQFLRSIFLNEKVLAHLIYLSGKVMGNQWRRAQGLHSLRRLSHVGENVRFLGNAQIYDPDRLVIGNDVRIGRNAFLFCKGGLEIGDGTVISRNVTIYTANHDILSASLPYNDLYVEKSVKIGRGVWIGMNVSITPGVEIGDGAVVGMGAVVSKDVQSGETVVGASTRVVRRRDPAEILDSVERGQFFARQWPDL